MISNFLITLEIVHIYNLSGLANFIHVLGQIVSLKEKKQYELIKNIIV